MRNFMEAFVDTTSGLIIATLLQIIIFPYFGMYPDLSTSFHISLIFTAISLLRSWFWRVFFNKNN